MAKREEYPQSTPEMYEVLVSFTDPDDKNTVYSAGKDQYPRAGYTPTEERVAFLQSAQNRFRRPVIAKK
jgi:hypothetical protein